MASIANEYDARFDEAEADVDRGEPWRFRGTDAPNPLTLATGWSTGHTHFGEAEFLNGVDQDGKAWSVLVGSIALRSRSSRDSSRSGRTKRTATSSPTRSGGAARRGRR